MFNTHDKFTLTVMAFDETNQQLPFSVELPINDSENFTLPDNTDYVSFFQYYETSGVISGNFLFSIHTGVEMLGNQLRNYLEKGKVKTDNIIGKTDTKDFWNKRLCCKIDLSTEILTIRKVLEADDRVVDSLNSLETIVLESSAIFKEFNKSVAAMKIFGKNKTENFLK